MAKQIDTHLAAAEIVEMFDNLLIDHEMSIETYDTDEEVDEEEREDREATDDTLGLWSMPYAQLQDMVEEYLLALLAAKNKDTVIEPYKYQGQDKAIID